MPETEALLRPKMQCRPALTRLARWALAELPAWYLAHPEASAPAGRFIGSKKLNAAVDMSTPSVTLMAALVKIFLITA